MKRWRIKFATRLVCSFPSKHRAGPALNQTELQVERKMSIAKWALSSLAFLCLALNIGFAATGLPYVQEGQNVITYSVNHTTAVAKKLVQASGSSIPGNPSTVAFGPDGFTGVCGGG
jgi:hypothetical protein